MSSPLGQFLHDLSIQSLELDADQRPSQETYSRMKLLLHRYVHRYNFQILEVSRDSDHYAVIVTLSQVSRRGFFLFVSVLIGWCWIIDMLLRSGYVLFWAMSPLELCDRSVLQWMDSGEPLLNRQVQGSLRYHHRTMGSDIDACLVLPNCASRREEISALRRINEAVMHKISKFKEAGVEVSMVIPAKVPILRFCDANGNDLFDLSINNLRALDNSNLVELFGALDSRVRVLGRLIKYWAKSRGINNRWYCLLVSFFTLPF